MQLYNYANWIKPFYGIPGKLKKCYWSTLSIIASRHIAECENKEFSDRLSIVSIARDEAPYIREWALFHKSIGVDRIYLYDNQSTDGMRDEVQDLIDCGFIVYKLFPGSGKQYAAYEDAIRYYKRDTKWMAFIDIDEFLMPCSLDSDINLVIEDIVSRGGSGAAGIAVNWRMFGSSGHKARQAAGVIDSFLWRANDSHGDGNNCIKTIANPRKIYKYRHAHYPIYYSGYYSVNEESVRCDGAYNSTIEPLKRLRINHYFTKSYSEWLMRRSRKVADKRFGNRRSAKQIEEEFFRFDTNESFDALAFDLKYRGKRMRSDGI